MAVEAYPLSWPAGWPRTKVDDRRFARFNRKEYVQGSSYRRTEDITVDQATHRVIEELEKMGVVESRIIISTNIETTRDGWPRSDRKNPTDPGVAVYWNDPDSKQQQCMAIDLYKTVAGNLAGVAATISAMRAIERHGGAQILKRAFEGFKALPSSTTPAFTPAQAAESVAARIGWRSDVILSDREHAKNALRLAMSKTHPDAGGAQHDFQMVQEAKRVLSAHHGVSL